MCSDYAVVVVMEDGIKHAGIASSISETLRDKGKIVSLHSVGVPLEFIEHSKRSEILEDIDVTPIDVVAQISEWIK